MQEILSVFLVPHGESPENGRGPAEANVEAKEKA
jgi:hypothetical protein